MPSKASPRFQYGPNVSVTREITPLHEIAPDENQGLMGPPKPQLPMFQSLLTQ